MNIPNKISILGVEYKVQLVDNLKDDKGEPLCGLTEGNKKTISICTVNNDSEEEKFRTLIHEACHAILHVSGTGCLLNEKTEEAIVTALENGLYSIFKELK